MKIQYASDLHLEFPQNKEYLKSNPLLPAGDVLLLAGDIVPFAVMDQHEDFFSYCADHFQTTWWIPGNHEYYYYDLSQKCGSLNENIRSNVHLVNNLSLEQDSTRFIFSTLWSFIPPAHQWQIANRMSDFQVIRYKDEDFTPDRFNQLHENALSFIKTELQRNYNGKTVVVTHHVPTLLNYPEQYKGDLLNEAFAVELFDFIETTAPDYWIYGHHHCNTTPFSIGTTQMLTNQLGYLKHNEQAGFNSKALLDFENLISKPKFAQ